LFGTPPQGQPGKLNTPSPYDLQYSALLVVATTALIAVMAVVSRRGRLDDPSPTVTDPPQP
jgi:hypothetical protein